MMHGFRILLISKSICYIKINIQVGVSNLIQINKISRNQSLTILSKLYKNLQLIFSIFLLIDTIYIIISSIYLILLQKYLVY